ncbi:MAG: Rha family transcriptional regulator [Magnetococcales bacterium]|nr:Rha family transcriptional regulator [Magnetococcales bacterium]
MQGPVLHAWVEALSRSDRRDFTTAVLDGSPPIINVVNDQVRAKSTDIAVYFEKRHDNDIRAIINLQLADLFKLPNFGETVKPNTKGVPRPVVDMTRDGFTLLEINRPSALTWINPDLRGALEPAQTTLPAHTGRRVANRFERCANGNPSRTHGQKGCKPL